MKESGTTANKVFWEQKERNGFQSVFDIMQDIAADGELGQNWTSRELGQEAELGQHAQSSADHLERLQSSILGCIEQSNIFSSSFLQV
jgi:hypothetical protein